MSLTPLPTVQIKTVLGRLGFDADLGKMEIKQPPPTVEMKTTLPKMKIEQPRGDLKIDQTKAWDALARSDITALMNRIYSQVEGIALQGVSNIVEKGNRMAAIHTGENVIADSAQEEWRKEGTLRIPGEASYDNVDIIYKKHPPSIQAELGTYDLRVVPHRPEINYTKGKFQAYLLQKQSIEMIPPRIDLTL